MATNQEVGTAQRQSHYNSSACSERRVFTANLYRVSETFESWLGTHEGSAVIGSCEMVKAVNGDEISASASRSLPTALQVSYGGDKIAFTPRRQHSQGECKGKQLFS